MSKRKNAEKAFIWHECYTFDVLWEVAQNYIEFKNLTGKQIGQILNFGLAQKTYGEEHAE